jgi:hypothetical protein
MDQHALSLIVPVQPKQSAFAGALLVASTVVTAATCQSPTVSPSIGVINSKWQEFSSNGSRLVEENGILHTTHLQARMQCNETEWHINWERSKGQRNYEGITNTLQPAISRTDIDEQAMRVSAVIPLHGQWFGGLGIEQRNTSRHINSIEQATGYFEQFQKRSVLIGLLYQYPVTDAATLSAALWIGQLRQGQVRLDLPDTSTTSLSLGAGQVTEASLTWSSRISPTPGWSWSYSLHWHQSRTAAGTSEAIMSNGHLKGSARQPQTNIQSMGMLGSLIYNY